MPSRAAGLLESPVALRKESVDRNTGTDRFGLQAWRVALRKESVDRNAGKFHTAVNVTKSLSARRAWIEIQRWRDHHTRPIVALRKESVDRNVCDKIAFEVSRSRSPQGERG